MKTRAALVIASSLLTRAALADDHVITLDRTCVEIDRATDGLVDADREQATRLMQQVLERADLFVVTSDCTETFTLSHERDGARFVIRMRSSAGKRRMTTPALDELADKYDRLAQSLIEAKAVMQAEPAEPAAHATGAERPAGQPRVQPAVAAAGNELEPLATSDAADAEPVATEPRRKTRIWYGMIGAQLTGGGSAALGYRAELSSVSLDMSASMRSSETSTSGASLGIELLHNKVMSPSTALYGGGGLSFGTLETNDYGSSSHYYGTGVQGELTAGIHFGRLHGAQPLVQLDLTIPFFELGNDFGSKTYRAAATISAGLGF